jgi:hypothetical protein
MARRQYGHEHSWHISAHTTDQVGKKVRVLLGCNCGATDVIRPHAGKKHDPTFFAKLATYSHVCCQGPLPEDKPQETAA